MKQIAESELILNPDGSIYHLHLLPEDIADLIITVGDPRRVEMVSSFFDSIELKKKKREFVTHTGNFKGKRISVISTGIGTDNIDIVMNELDALANINFKTRTINNTHRSLQIVRIGTSGCMDENIPVDATLLSAYGLGMDGLLNFYDYQHAGKQAEIENQLASNSLFQQIGIRPYLFSPSTHLLNQFLSSGVYQGITATCTGFYGPQGRRLRLPTKLKNLHGELRKIQIGELKVTNFEMETAAIYGMAQMLGHEAISINLLIANRARGEFSKNPQASMLKQIEWSLNQLVG